MLYHGRKYITIRGDAFPWDGIHGIVVGGGGSCLCSPLHWSVNVPARPIFTIFQIFWVKSVQKEGPLNNYIVILDTFVATAC